MPNSLKVMIKKLEHKRCISSAECDELLTKLNGHDSEIRADERRKFAEWLEENDMLVRWEHDDEYVRNGVLNACNIIEMYEQRGVEK